MKKVKKLITTAAVVALMSGGMALAADNTTRTDRPTAKTGDTEIFHDREDVPQRMTRLRMRHDQERYTPPQHGDRQLATCLSNPLLQAFGGLFGFDEILVRCEDND